MARTDPEAVKKVMLPTVITDVGPFITAANQVVTGVCVPLGYTDLELEVIERWLAAQYAVEGNTGGRKTRQKIGQAEDEFSNSQADTIKSQVYRLDYKGGISTLDAMSAKGMRQRRVGVVHVGDRRGQIADRGFLPLPSQTTSTEVIVYDNTHP